MSKLLELKKWLTLSDAADWLSFTLNEPVSEADILQFALDGKITLSVQFPNFAMAIEITDIEEKVIVTFLSNLAFEGIDYVQNFKKSYLESEDFAQIIQSLKNTPDKNKSDEIKTYKLIPLSGIYNIVMAGAERLDVMHKYQMLTDGQEIDLINVNGTFVENESGHLYKLMKNTIELGIDKNKYPQEYIPALGLPEDSIYGVRISALMDFTNEILEKNPEMKSVSIRTKEERWLDVIGTMAILLYETGKKTYSKGTQNTHINMEGIANAIKDRMLERDLNLSNERLSNINKDISKALSIEPFCSYFIK